MSRRRTRVLPLGSLNDASAPDLIHFQTVDGSVSASFAAFVTEMYSLCVAWAVMGSHDTA